MLTLSLLLFQTRASRWFPVQSGAATQRAVPRLQSSHQGERAGARAIQRERAEPPGEGEGERILQGAEPEQGQRGVQEIL